jgi:hypothetical protein
MSSKLLPLILLISFSSCVSNSSQTAQSTDCSSIGNVYHDGYSYGTLSRLMAGSTGDCATFVDEYNEKTGVMAVRVSDCFCEGFNDGYNGVDEKWKEDTLVTNPTSTQQTYSNDTTRPAITQPSVQIDTTTKVLVDTTKQIQTSNNVVITNNNTNTTVVDDDKKSIIEKYLKGQDNRNFESFSQYYAPNIRRNWEMYNPTLSQIQGAIYHLWSVTSSSSQTINNAKMVNDSTVKTDVTNVYITRKKNLTKQIEYDIYFVFDSNNQIVETYGFEK